MKACMASFSSSPLVDLVNLNSLILSLKSLAQLLYFKMQNMTSRLKEVGTETGASHRGEFFRTDLLDTYYRRLTFPRRCHFLFYYPDLFSLKSPYRQGRKKGKSRNASFGLLTKNLVLCRFDRWRTAHKSTTRPLVANHLSGITLSSSLVILRTLGMTIVTGQLLLSSYVPPRNGIIQSAHIDGYVCCVM